MQAVDTSGFLDKSQEDIVRVLHSGIDGKKKYSSDEERFAVMLQTAWRKRQARLHVAALLQSSLCKAYREANPSRSLVTDSLVKGEKQFRDEVRHCDACERSNIYS